MNIIEKCEIEFQTGRKAGGEDAIKTFTMQELVDELSKRDGVTIEQNQGVAVWGTTHEEIKNGTAKYDAPRIVLVIKK
jgi:hypothetical protein